MKPESEKKSSPSPSNKVTVGGMEDYSGGNNSMPEKQINSFESKSPTGSGGVV
jgi:hypothetical protein